MKPSIKSIKRTVFEVTDPRDGEVKVFNSEEAAKRQAKDWHQCATRARLYHFYSQRLNRNYVTSITPERFARMILGSKEIREDLIELLSEIVDYDE